MKTAVFVVCLIGLAYAFPASDSNSSPLDSPESHSSIDSHPDTSSSEEFTITPAVNNTLVPLTDEPRGDSLRFKRALRRYFSSSESHSNSGPNSYPDSSSSSSEEFRIIPTVEATTAGQDVTGNLRRKRAADQDPHSSSSSEVSSESTTTESASSQSHPSESSEEDSHERSTKQNLLQAILETSTVPDTSEESSEERTTNTPIFQP